jgi:hypothetical protein
MTEYEELVEALVGIAKVTRPSIDLKDDADIQRQKGIQHGICDLLEDAAVAIDDLMTKLKDKNNEGQNRECTEAA